MVRLSSWSLGVLLIVIVAFIWNAASILVQAIFTVFEFNKPFFLTYLANSLFVVTLPLRSLSQLVQRYTRSRRTQPAEPSAAWPSASSSDDQCHPLTSDGAALRKIGRAALIVCPMWFLANFLYNWSLGMTSVTSSTVISSSSVAFTLLFSVFLLGEPLTLLKLLGVLLCWAGNILTAVGDRGDCEDHRPGPAPPPAPASPPSEAAVANPVLGDAICLLSALMYGCYTTAIRYFSPEDMALFFGLLGSCTFVLLGPVVLGLHLSGVEGLAALTPAVLGLIVLKGLADNVLSDYLWARAVLLTSPAVATVGLSLTIPMALVSQLVLPPAWLLSSCPPSALDGAASLCVVAGFVVINHASRASTAADAHFCQRALRMPLLWPRANDGQDTGTADAEITDGRRPPQQLPSEEAEGSSDERFFR